MDDILENITAAIRRHYEIQRQVRALQEEDKLVVQFLDRQWEGDIEEAGIKKTPVVSYSVDADMLTQLANNNEHLQECVNSISRWKCELNLRGWKALSETDQITLSPAITEKPGKTKYECKALEEDVL